MTKEEALTSHVIYRVFICAVNSNFAARELDSDRANSHTQSAEFYAKWLANHGHDVELEIAEENSLRHVVTLTVDGRKIVKNGVYVSQKQGPASDGRPCEE